MGITPPRRFFSKAGDSAKRFFTKQTADTARDVFKKAPAQIDIALRKSASTLKEAAPIVGKIGTGISMAAPVLAAVPSIGMPLSAAAAGAGTALQKSEKGIGKLGQTVSDIRRETTLKKGSGIMASKPESKEEDGLPFY